MSCRAALFSVSVAFVVRLMKSFRATGSSPPSRAADAATPSLIRIGRFCSAASPKKPTCWCGRVRRETGRRLKVQVLYGEGLASHTGPESCVAVREDRCEALTGECVGQPLSGENQLRGADVLRPSEGDTACVDSARRSPTPRRRRTWHAQNPSVREPGDLQAVRGGHCTDRVGKAGGHSRR